ncbi:hypothetical protein A3K63_04675 [Candidatus Micrarchaeota archaeon RBG_16_49_10]|nr:MAG: hypothetical protein A3K63_04675 [Candidatus Micrarchaeota archaeon RBG_16_49_10]
MDVIVPAAGYATRLGDEAKGRPKHLIDVQGRLILDYVLEKVYEIPEVERVVIVTNQKFFGQFSEWAERERYRGLTVLNDRTASNEDRLGTMGDVLFAINDLGLYQDLLVLGGDNLFEDSLLGPYKYFSDSGKPVICTYDVGSIESAKKFGVVTVDESSRITELIEKPENPPSTLISTLIYFFPEAVIDLMRRYQLEGNNMDRAGDFIHWLVRETDVYAYPIEKWWDIGSPETLEEARSLYGKGRLKSH